ncbi:hypothetical protein ACFYT4_33540 [Streptomyces sp. NPDC004609]|uniref:hypothetical protein n=1 Tax=Streptomyces sp. NPDC004609 TaxID=3364704 RepID=UPI00369F44EC
MEMQTWRNARITAETAAQALQDALASLGVPERVRQSIRPVVTASGRAYVEIGMPGPNIAEQLAEALRAAAPPARRPEVPVAMRWLDTGSGPGAMVPVVAKPNP